MPSLLRRSKHQKPKRQKIAEHAAMLAFLRSSAKGEDVGEYARLIGEDADRCVVEVGYGVSRPANRRFFSVQEGTALATEIPFEEAHRNWGVEYER